MDRITLCLIGLLYVGLLAAQDNVYTPKGNFYNVRIFNNQPDYIEFDPEDFTKPSVTIHKANINLIERKGRFRETIIHDSHDKFHIIYSYIDDNGDTLTGDPSYNPAGDLVVDSAVKLCRFKKDNEYVSFYGTRPHFYISDPEKKFLNSKKVTYVGVNFSYLKLINEHDLPKAAVLKKNDLRDITYNINHYDNMAKYRYNFFKGKETVDAMYLSESSYQSLDPMSWIIAEDNYQIEPGKIPDMVKGLHFPFKEGIGVVFIIEKLSKPGKAVSGYWVVFDFAGMKTLLIDYVLFSKVQLQVEDIMNGWYGFWKSGIHSAGVYEPVSFQKYLDLEKKAQFEMLCD